MPTSILATANRVAHDDRVSRTAHQQESENIRPHVSVVMNFTKPTESKPALAHLERGETFSA
jgi:Zn-dependent oligopeptidase